MNTEKQATFERRIFELEYEVEGWKVKIQQMKNYQEILETEISDLKEIIAKQRKEMKTKSEANQ